MSKFFRSNDSTSSSDSDSASDSDDELAASALESSVTLNSNIAAPAPTTPAPWTPQHHKDFLLHALLEERCMNEALSSNPGRRRDSPEIQSDSHRRYQRLCERLASYNLISAGLEEDQHALTRQRYRDGLDVLSQQTLSTTTVAPAMRRMLTEPVMDATDRAASVHVVSEMPDIGRTEHFAVPYPIRRLLTGPDSLDYPMTTLGRSRPQTLLESRYCHEFEELGTLGRGGYGVVYHVRHRLDNQTYAIKKVPLSAGRLQRIQRRGQSELEEVLREVRTLARLDHPNIVRYYGGWIEWVDAMTASEQTSPANNLVSDSDGSYAEGGAVESSQSMHRVTTERSTEDTEVVFEDSGMALRTELSFSNRDASNNDMQLRRVGTKSTTATVSDETVESVDRSVDDPSFSIQSSGINFAEPTLALHVQMSLHPMTLADFLAPSPPPTTSNSTTSAPALSHCFHVDPSLSILLSILDGMEYLHSEGIVHRDIKPANIFLGPHSNPRATRGSVDLLLCNDCRALHTANPIRLEVRIGDFGLVSVVDPEVGNSTAISHAPSQRKEVVGTEMYRPTSAVHAASPALDVYALGIVAFELLCKFETRMERLHCIQQLKEDCFPNAFLADVDAKRSGGVKNCIKGMLASDALSVPEVREMLSKLQEPSV